jgi:hypothetical protein
MTRAVSFEQACSRYVHRYTVEHIPAWSREPCNGKYYAPQFRSDREWYENTKFYGENEVATKKHCYTSGQTWPLGQWLDQPFSRAKRFA